MATVKFCTTCDICNKRSEEYSSFPRCPECFSDYCPECMKEIVGSDKWTEDERNEYYNPCIYCEDLNKS